MWLDICGIPLTIVGILWLLCVVRGSPVPVIYYTNLLISNVIQLCSGFIMLAGIFYPDTLYIIGIGIYCSGVIVSLGFRMCIALERCFVITCPQLPCIRQLRGSVLVCIVVWVLCIIIVAPAAAHGKFLPSPIFALLAAPLFITCLIWTIKALPAAALVPADEKRRIVGTLVLLLLNYSLMIFPAAVWGLMILTLSGPYANHVNGLWASLLVLSPFVDLILLFFMQKGPVDRLLARLCTSGTDANIAADASSTSVV